MTFFNSSALLQCARLFRAFFLRSILLSLFISLSLLRAQSTPLANQTLQLPNYKQLQFSLVDDPNNEADSETGFGGVTNNFQISTYQTTAAQYALFLNAVTPTGNRYELYDDRMASDPDVACITYNPDELPHYKPIPGREDLPITYVDLCCAVRFCNWMSHGCPSIDPTAGITIFTESITETGAYTIHSNQDSLGMITSQIEEMPNAPVFIPNENQWYKAAYYHHDTGKIITYDPDDPIVSVQNQGSFKYWNYPTQSMSAPLNSPSDFYNANVIANYYDPKVSSWWGPDYTTDTYSYWGVCSHSGVYLTGVGTFSNSPGPYGTFDMAGNVNEWIFSEDAVTNPEQVLCPIRGGSWQSTSVDLNRQTRHLVTATTKNNTTGFRIACQAPPTAIGKSDDLTSDIIQNAIAGNETYEMIGETAFFFFLQEACEMAFVYKGTKIGELLSAYVAKIGIAGILGTIAEALLFGPQAAITFAAQWGIHMGLDCIGLATIDYIGKSVALESAEIEGLSADKIEELKQAKATSEAKAAASKYGLGEAVAFYEHLHHLVDTIFTSMGYGEVPQE